MKISKQVIDASVALLRAIADANKTDVTQIERVRVDVTSDEPNVEFDVKTTITIDNGSNLP